MISFFRKKENKKIVMGRCDDTSDITIATVIKSGEKPLFTRTEGGLTYGLYIVGEDELWLDENRIASERGFVESTVCVNAEKECESYEADLEFVASRAVDAHVKDSVTGEDIFMYQMPSGEIKAFSPAEVVRKRKEILNRPKKKTPEELRFEGVCRRNECLVVRGHMQCDESVGVFVDEDGKFVRATLGAVKRKRIEMGLEKAPEECE